MSGIHQPTTDIEMNNFFQKFREQINENK